MVRNPADLEIRDIRPKDPVRQGNGIQPEVDVFNRNTEPAPDEDFDIGYVTVSSPQYSQFLLFWCFIIAPQETFEVDSCTSNDDVNCDEDTDMIDQDVTMNVEAGGIFEDQFNGCNETNIENNASSTDTATHTVELARPVGEISTFNSFSGPFEPGSTPVIAEYTAANAGDTGELNIEFAELTSEGNVFDEICRREGVAGSSGGEFGVRHDASAGVQCERVISPDNPIQLRPQLRNERGVTQYWGLKVWGKHETEPSYPNPQIVTRTRR